MIAETKIALIVDSSLCSALFSVPDFNSALYKNKEYTMYNAVNLSTGEAIASAKISTMDMF
jgi:hypothetical protein